MGDLSTSFSGLAVALGELPFEQSKDLHLKSTGWSSRLSNCSNTFSIHVCVYVPRGQFQSRTTTRSNSYLPLSCRNHGFVPLEGPAEATLNKSFAATADTMCRKLLPCHPTEQLDTHAHILPVPTHPSSFDWGMTVPRGKVVTNKLGLAGWNALGAGSNPHCADTTSEISPFLNHPVNLRQ